MLTWNVTYHCKSGQREAFYQALCDLGIRANSLKEEGNLKYDYFLAAEAPDDLLLVESWTTPELQQAHCQTEIFGRLQELKAQYCDSVQIDKFNCLDGHDLYEPADGVHFGAPGALFLPYAAGER